MSGLCSRFHRKQPNLREMEPAGMRKILSRSGASDLDGYYWLPPKEGSSARCAEFVRVAGGKIKIFESCKPLTKPHMVVCAVGKNDNGGDESQGRGTGGSEKDLGQERNFRGWFGRLPKEGSRANEQSSWRSTVERSRLLRAASLTWLFAQGRTTMMCRRGMVIVRWRLSSLWQLLQR